MRILRVIPSMNPEKGGPCQGIRNSVPEMSKRGVENEIVCFDDIDAPFLRDDELVIFPLGHAVGLWGYNKKLIPWLLDNLGNYDAVVIHGLWSYHSFGVFKGLSEFKKRNLKYPKLFVMPHGMLDPYFQKAPERRLKAVRNWVYWKLVEGKVINGSDGLLFTCEEELILARESFFPYNPKVELNVGYGIVQPPEYVESMKEAFSTKVPNWNKKPFILFLSRINDKKGIELLVNAYLRVEQELNFEIPQLVIAGPGLESTYGKRLVSLGLSSTNILFPGMLVGDSKWGAFYECEVFFLPSHQENFGIAVVEALATGTPVIISDKVNIWREIDESGGGIVCSDDFLGVYSALRKWIVEDSDLKLFFSAKARNTYLSNFVTEKTVQKFIDKIKGVVGK